jgi:hypothetical protein
MTFAIIDPAFTAADILLDFHQKPPPPLNDAIHYLFGYSSFLFPP